MARRKEDASATLRNGGYDLFVAAGGTLSFNDYKEACETFNERVGDQIIVGKTFAPGHRIGELSVVRVERSFVKPRIDWAKSMVVKAEILAEGGTPKSPNDPDGEEWFVYFTDSDYCRFYWDKKNCGLPTKTAYSFHATRGAKGLKGRLQERLRRSPLSKQAFRVLRAR